MAVIDLLTNQLEGHGWNQGDPKQNTRIPARDLKRCGGSKQIMSCYAYDDANVDADVDDTDGCDDDGDGDGGDGGGGGDADGMAMMMMHRCP